MNGPDPKETAAILIARYARRDAAAHERAERLRQQVRAAVPRLARELGARRAWLFGSLVWGPVFLDADVDVAVEGLRGAQEDALAAALRARVEAEVDVVRLEDAPESLRSRILQDAELLYPPSESSP